MILSDWCSFFKLFFFGQSVGRKGDGYGSWPIRDQFFLVRWILAFYCFPFITSSGELTTQWGMFLKEREGLAGTGPRPFLQLAFGGTPKQSPRISVSKRSSSSSCRNGISVRALRIWSEDTVRAIFPGKHSIDEMRELNSFRISLSFGISNIFIYF